MRKEIEVGEGYRRIDMIVDEPQEGDEFFNPSILRWVKRADPDQPFQSYSEYRRRIEPNPIENAFRGFADEIKKAFADRPAENQKDDLQDITPEIAGDWKLLEQAILGRRGLEQQSIALEVARWGALMLRKNRDYGGSVWRKPILAPECEPGVAIRVRMSDKVSRLMSLLEKGKGEVNESIDDTMRDLGAYCLLELARPGRVAK